MSKAIQTQLGYALPPAQRHAITFHVPLWSNILRFVEMDPTLFASFKSVYPRIMLNADLKALVKVILDFTKTPEDQTAFLFSSPLSASECVDFGTSPKRGEVALLPSQMSIRVFDFHVRIYAVIFPAAKMKGVVAYWQNAGAGVASRLAEECLDRTDLLREVTDLDSVAPKIELSPAHAQIKERIAGLLERAPLPRNGDKKVDKEDVYLFQTGMASIYSTHKFLLKKYNSHTAFFGIAFHSTLHVFEDFGPGFKLFGHGTSEDLNALEIYMDECAKEGKGIQAIWAEFPTNPKLTVPDLARLRKVADRHGALLVVDDTIGGFCNVDLLGVADVLITSLTKSFSGYADVMGGSVVLNPSSHRYSELKELFGEWYKNDYCNGDAEQIEKNSRDYLDRSTVLNNNALRLVEFLQTKASDPESTVTKVLYPTTSFESLANYRERMRLVTSEFTPGYGCLFAVQFDSEQSAGVFYDNLNTHTGPHLGAHLTLALPYVKGLYAKQIEWARGFGMWESQIRVAPGLEDTEDLVREFESAVRKTDEIRAKGKGEGEGEGV